MREIKFRAWDKLNNKLIFHFVLWSDGKKAGLADPMLPNGDDYERFDFKIPRREDLVIMQFTGLNDKNGKEIYEYDIFSIGSPTNIYFVRYRWGKFMLSQKIPKERADKYTLPDEKGDYYYNIDIAAYSKDWKIIGNIYENSELLAEDKL